MVQLRYLLAPLIALAVGLGATAFAWRLAEIAVADELRTQFNQLVDATVDAVRTQMRGYEQVLRGGAGLFAASDHVSRGEWRAYVASLRLHETYPGTRGVYYAEHVTAAEKAAHTVRVRAEVFRDYSIRPAGTRAEYAPVVYTEPYVRHNPLALGFDMYSESVRRAAMERARDTGRAAATGKLLLADPGETPQPGFIMYYPVYHKGRPVATVAERRKALLGFVLCPFRIPELMQGMLPGPRRGFNLEIFDFDISPASVMFDDGGALHALAPRHDSLALTATLEVAQRPWQLHFEARPEFMGRAARVLPNAVLGTGMLLSLLFAALAFWLAAGRESALDAATHDALTGLYNRRYMEETLEREEARAHRGDKPIGIIMLDIDHFKDLNDTYGHDAGDQVLRSFADFFRKQVREEDIACRYGGEEFTVILPGAAVATAAARAEALRAGINRLSVEHQGRALGTITISAGVAVYPGHGPTVMDVLKEADQALLRAKHAGRNRVEIA